MLVLMRRCGVVIADLSGVNANVVYELGVARSLDKKVVPLCQRRLIRCLPSNIANDQLLQESAVGALAARCKAREPEVCVELAGALIAGIFLRPSNAWLKKGCDLGDKKSCAFLPKPAPRLMRLGEARGAGAIGILEPSA